MSRKKLDFFGESSHFPGRNFQPLKLGPNIRTATTTMVFRITLLGQTNVTTQYVYKSSDLEKDA